MAPTTAELKDRKREVDRARKAAEARAKKLGVRIEDLRDERGDHQERAHDLAKRKRELVKAIADAKAEESIDTLWTKYACVDGATTFRGLALVLNVVEARTSWAGGANALDRTVAHHDDCGDKSSQQELFDGFQAGLPGFFPANPPGTGSHEGICDSTLARVLGRAVGSKLNPWEWGLDLSDGPGFEAGAESLGFRVIRPYGNEAWHCNLTENPTAVLKKLGVIG